MYSCSASKFLSEGFYLKQIYEKCVKISMFLTFSNYSFLIEGHFFLSSSLQFLLSYISYKKSVYYDMQFNSTMLNEFIKIELNIRRKSKPIIFKDLKIYDKHQTQDLQ